MASTVDQQGLDWEPGHWQGWSGTFHSTDQEFEWFD